LQQEVQQQRQLEVGQHQNNVAQQQEMDWQAEVEHIQQAILIQNNQALAAIPKGCCPYHEPAQFGSHVNEWNVLTVMLCISSLKSSQSTNPKSTNV
jgi:hypothetical protein